MNTVNPADFVADQFPKQYWPLIPTTLRTAYAAVDKMVRDEPILQVKSAQDNKGRFVSYAVDFGFVRLIESGSLPFDYRWSSFAKPTGRYLEIRLSHSVVSISQVADPKSQPRNVVFRANGRLNNEPFFNLSEFEDEQRVKGLPHLLVLHGHQSLTFAHLAVPHPCHHRDFRYSSENLLNLPHELETEGPPPEDTDIDLDALNLLKDDITKWRRDHGE